jgi:ribonuclease HI
MPQAMGGPPKQKIPKEARVTRDWIAELSARWETQDTDVGTFTSQLQLDKMATLTTDGGARPNPGAAGWSAVVRENGHFICLWKHYDRASNNVVELCGVIAGLTFLPQDSIVWVSTDSQHVQKGINEWMPNWKRNGWKNSKKAGVASKSLWLALDAEIARHRMVEFSWMKAHSGLLLNGIADTLATRGVKGTTFCPTNRFDALPADTEPEDDLRLQGMAPVITQTDEWDEDEHLPTFSVRATSQGVAEDEDRNRKDAMFNRFSRDVLGNSSAEVPENSDSELPAQWEHTVVMTGDMSVVGEEQSERQPVIDFKPWENTWTWPHAFEAAR